MTVAEHDALLAAIDKIAHMPWSRYCPHAPHPPQAAFCALDNFEALYGGAAGGGKSDALLMAALQYTHVPGYAALLLRKTYADLSLPGALMDRAQQWLAPSNARWDDTTKTWRFPSGASLTFGYLQTSNDKYRYQGAEFQMIGFDEATQFVEDDYAYLSSRLRRLADSEIPLRLRAASNPGGVGHNWVKRRFIDAVTSVGRAFVPARVEDNPSLDQAAYRRSLEELSPTLRAQLLSGDWDARDLSGREFFSAKMLDRVEAAEPTRIGVIVGSPVKGGKIQFVRQTHGEVQLWTAPKQGSRYTIGADVAGTTERSKHDARPLGEQIDAYCAYCVDDRSGQLVASLYGRGWTEDEYAEKLAQLGRLYNNAHLAVEKQGGYGTATVILLRQRYAYPNQHVGLDDDSTETMDEGGAYGFTMNSTTRPVVLADLSAALRDRPSAFKDAALLGEMRTFVTNDRGRPEADTGTHDDRVMAMAITQHVRNMRATRPLSVGVKTPARKQSAVSPIRARAPKTRGRE